MNDLLFAANAISQSLTFSLRRQYLDTPLAELRCLQPVKLLGESNLLPPIFMKLEQIGQASSGNPHPFVALQTALTACHQPGSYTLIFLIHSEGAVNHIYLGARPHQKEDAGGAAQAYMNQLANFLRGNWPGTRLSATDFEEELKPRLAKYCSQGQPSFVNVLTGVPSLKPGDQPGYPQSLDRLLRGLRGEPFAYLVVAEPMSEATVNDIVYNCRNLLSQVHLMTKLSLTETHQAGVSATLGNTRTDGLSFAAQTGMSEGASYERSLNLQLGMGLLANLFPPAVLLAMLGPSFGQSRSTQESRSFTETESWSQSIASTYGYNSSIAHAAGREYINAHAQATEEELRHHIARIEQAGALGCWRTSVFFLTQNQRTAQHGSAQLRALFSGEKSKFEPIRIHDVSHDWQDRTESTPFIQRALANFKHLPLRLVNPQDYTQPLAHPLGAAFEGLDTPLNTEELALLINLPRRETPGVRLSATADFTLNPPTVPKLTPTLQIGNLLEGGEETTIPYRLPVAGLAKHALLTGITGSGKSTTCRRLLQEVQKANLPFLVIEPAKTEYVEWAFRCNQALSPDDPRRIQVFMPGLSTWRGEALPELHLNPLDLVWLTEADQPQVLTHADRLKSILNASFPMQEVLPVLLEDALFDSYRIKGWFKASLLDRTLARPTLGDLLNRIPDIVRSKGYDKPITANLTAALMTRIESLRRGWKSQLFDQPTSTPWSEIFDRPAVINLAHLGDDADKAFTMAILWQFLYEYRQAQQMIEQRSQPITTPPKTELRHLTVVEEAHRILLKSLTPTLEQANPQAKVAEMFANILSEIRSYGEGILIVDQSPVRLITDAIKNTNLKLTHRLVAEDDRDTMASCMTLNPEQKAIINRLRPGQAILFGDQDDMAAWVQVTETY